MKRIKIALTCLTFALAITGAIVAKANEKKRTATDTVYFTISGGGFGTLQGDAQYFDDANISTNASIKNNSNQDIQLFSNTGLSTAVKFVN